MDDLPIWVTTITHDISKTKNPGKMTEEELLALYEKAFAYSCEYHASHKTPLNPLPNALHVVNTGCDVPRA